MSVNKWDILNLISVDKNGNILPPNPRQLLDKDVREFYIRDKSPKKEQYFKEAGVIYYIADFYSPPNQQGYNPEKALKDARINFDLPRDFECDSLMLKLIERYKEINLTEIKNTISSFRQTVRNMRLVSDKMNNILSDKLIGDATTEDIEFSVNLMGQISKLINSIPSLIKSLDESFELLITENGSEIGRGNQVIVSSMDATAQM